MIQRLRKSYFADTNFINSALMVANADGAKHFDETTVDKFKLLTLSFTVVNHLPQPLTLTHNRGDLDRRQHAAVELPPCGVKVRYPSLATHRRVALPVCFLVCLLVILFFVAGV